MSILCSGSFVADILVPDLPYIGPPGSLTYAPSGITLSPGGHSANVAIDLAQLEAENIHAVGSIGRDEMGDFIVEQLKNRGVNPLPEIHQESTTAKNVALLVKGEDRRYIAEFTANSLLTSSHLRASLSQVKPGIFYQGTLGGLPDVEKNLSEILAETNDEGTLNFLDVIVPSNGWGYLFQAMKLIHILHANQLEARSLTGKSDPHEAIKELNKAGVKLVIISDAHNGAIAGTRTHQIDMPAYDVAQRDPTGAGDALSAGIISYIQRNKMTSDEITDPDTIVQLLLFGQAAGAACVTGLGATTAVTMKNVKNILEQQREQVHEQTRMVKL
ncbi:MAG: carbohydrate kinase family protein [Candidatus Thorarchaeota archaeon]